MNHTTTLEIALESMVDEKVRHYLKANDVEVRGDMKTLRFMTKKGKDFCLDLVHAFRDELDYENGGFFSYNPGKFTFDKVEMKEWLSRNQWIFNDESWRGK